MRKLSVLLLATAGALCQRPVIEPDGIVNAATLAKLGAFHGIATGSIFTIFGRNLAETTETAAAVPLPTKLGGAEVLLEGTAVPLFYVSPSQINAQMPNGLMGGSLSRVLKSLVVRTPAGASDPAPVMLAPRGLGIFTLEASGCGRGAVFNVAPDGSLSLNGPDNPVSPGRVLTIFGTGFGETRPPALTGVPAPLDALLLPQNQVAAQAVPVGATLYAGRAPGLIGVDQLNFLFPAESVGGCGGPLRLSSDSSQSQPVPIFVGRNGTCPPLRAPDAFGALTLRRVETVSADGTTVSEELVVDLSAAIGKQVPSAPSPPLGSCGGPLLEYTPVPRGPSCPGFDDFYGKPLDAGPITLAGPGMQPMRFSPTVEQGRPVYRVPLPPGTMRPGEFVASAAGGADVGAFQVAIRVPPLIEVSTERPPDGAVYLNRACRVTWRGGDADSVVRERLISRFSPFLDNFYECAARASAGSAVIPTAHGGYIGLPQSIDGELRISMGAEGNQVQRFTAGGLSLGGQFTWLYQKRFAGLTLWLGAPL